MPIQAVIPVLVIVVGFVVYCLNDLRTAPAVARLPRWAWAVVILVSIPLGGIAYLALGKQQGTQQR